MKMGAESGILVTTGGMMTSCFYPKSNNEEPGEIKVELLEKIFVLKEELKDIARQLDLLLDSRLELQLNVLFGGLELQELGFHIVHYEEELCIANQKKKAILDGSVIFMVAIGSL